MLNITQLGNRLIRLAQQAHILRQFDAVKGYGQLLANLPQSPYQAISNYFLGVAANSKGRGNRDEAKRLFEKVISTGPDAYKIKSILSLGALARHEGDLDSAHFYYQEGIRTGKLSADSLHAIKGISHIKAIAGDHRQAIKDLESILLVIKYTPPHIYFDLLNSYAVELGEVGRMAEARNVANVVLASPLAFAYPEWQQTAADLQACSRSTVQVAGFRNVLAMPPAPERVIQSRPPEPAKVFSLAEWKEKMVKQPNDEPDENVDVMDRKDLLVKLLELAAQEDTDEEELRKVVKYAVEVMTKKR